MVERKLISKMKKIKNSIAIVALIALAFSACKKDKYFIGGDLHNPNVNVTTYDFLKNNERGLFDTLLLLVDAAGLKEEINQKDITFFTPTDYSITNYINTRTLQEQKVDPFRMWTIDSILKYEIDAVRDSLRTYIVPKVIDFSDLEVNGKGEIIKTKGGNYVNVTYEETDEPDLGYNSNSSHLPRIMYFNYVNVPKGTQPDIGSATWPLIRTRVQTSGIISTTGRINVLNNGHTLFFYGQAR